MNASARVITFAIATTAGAVLWAAQSGSLEKVVGQPKARSRSIDVETAHPDASAAQVPPQETTVETEPTPVPVLEAEYSDAGDCKDYKEGKEYKEYKKLPPVAKPPIGGPLVPGPFVFSPNPRLPPPPETPQDMTH